MQARNRRAGPGVEGGGATLPTRLLPKAEVGASGNPGRSGAATRTPLDPARVAVSRVD